MSSMPEHLKQRTSLRATVVLVVAFLVGAWAAIEVLTDSWDSYAYATSPKTTVTVEEPCSGRAYRYSDQPDICRGRWNQTKGTVHLRTEMEDAPSRPFTTEAAVRGDDAYLHGSTITHVTGLIAPWLLLLVGIVLGVLSVVQRRREGRRKAARQAWREGRADGEQTPLM